MADALRDEIVRRVETLPPRLQQKVLDFVQTLQEPVEGSVVRLLRFAGTIPKEDLDKMESAIQDACEGIDEGGW